MSHYPSKDHHRLTISPASSYDDNSENIDDLNKPATAIKKQKNLVALKTKGIMNQQHRNRHEFGISPVSLSSPTNNNATSVDHSNGKEYERMTSILAAAAYMGSADTSSSTDSSPNHQNTKNMDSSPASTDYSYASIKQRIIGSSNCSSSKNVPTTEQSPDSLRSLPFGSNSDNHYNNNHGSPNEDLNNTVVFTPYTGPATSIDQQSRRDSPASVDSSYASLKERIASARKPILTDQYSPDSIQSSMYASSIEGGSPEVLESYVSSSYFESHLYRQGPTSSLTTTSPCIPSNPQASTLQNSLHKNVGQNAILKNTSTSNQSLTSHHTKSSILSSRAPPHDNNVCDYPIEASPSAQSFITTFSNVGISPLNTDLQPVEGMDIVAEGQKTQQLKNKLLVDDESSRDFELLAFNSQETYDEIMMQDVRYPRVVKVAGKHDLQTMVAKNSTTKSKWKPASQSSARNLPPLSPHPSHGLAWSDQVLQTDFDGNSPLVLHEDSPLSLSIPLHEKSLSFIRNKFATEDDSKQDNTNLLKAVASSTISLSELRAYLSKQGSCQKDSVGRYPLHVLSSNYDLILPLLQFNHPKGLYTRSTTDEDKLKLNTNRLSSMMKCNRLNEMTQFEDIIFDLIRLNPKAMITKDSNGMIPFTAPLYEWIQKCNHNLDHPCLTGVDPSKVYNKALDDSAISIVNVQAHSRIDLEHGATILPESNRPFHSLKSDELSTRSKLHQISMFNNRWYHNMKTPLKSNQLHHNSTQEGDLSDVLDGLKHSEPLNIDEKSNYNFKVDHEFSFYVEWCLYMLGRILSLISDLHMDFDEDDDLHSLLVPYSSNASGFQAKFVSIICSVPSLMKLLVLKTDSFVTRADLSCIPIFDALLQSDDSIGNWIVFMLEDFDPKIVSRCVNYLECLSDRCGSQSSLKVSQPFSIESQRMQLFNKISNLNFLLPAALSIEKLEETQRAASTLAIQFSIDEELRKPMTMMIVFLDFIFRVLLIIAFQILSNDYVSKNSHHDGSYIVSFYLCLISIFYCLLRLLSKIISTVKISFGTYTNIIGGLNDWAERAAIGMALTAVIWIETIQNRSTAISLRNFICITTLCVWVQLLTWFYVVNPAATLFFRTIGKILSDLKWLWICLVSTILAFSQVFFILSSNSSTCINNSGVCNSHDVLLQSYSILFGKFNLLEFPTTFSKVLFVIFSIIVCIVLSNVLLGMTVCSIQSTMRTSTSTAINISRLSYVTEVRAFRRLLTTNWTLVKVMSLGLFIISAIFLFFTSSSSTRLLIAKIFDVKVLLAWIIALISIAFLSCVVFLSQISFIDPLEDQTNINKEVQSNCCGNNWLIHKTLFPFRKAILFLVGTIDDSESWWSFHTTRTSSDEDSGITTNDIIKDEFLQLQSSTLEKIDQLYDLLVSLQDKNKN